MDIKLHTDFHNHPNMADMAQGHNARALAAILAESGFESINVFIKCNGGFCYFPTETGVRFPFLDHDFLGEFTAACRDAGIRVFGYIAADRDLALAASHPEMLTVNRDGSTIKEPREDQFCMIMCLESEYGDLLCAITREAVEKYHLDGVFADNILADECYCPTCMALMRERGIDTDDPNAVKAFALERALLYAEKLKAACGGIPLEIKGLPFRAQAGISDCAYIPVMPQTDGYDTLPAQALYLRGFCDRVYSLVGRFLIGWGDFGGRRSPASVRNDTLDSLIYGVGFCLGDHIDPIRGADIAMYESYRPIMRELDLYQKRVAGYLPHAEIAVPIDSMEYIKRDTELAVRMLLQLHYTVDVVDECSDLSGYRAVVLTDSYKMTPTMANKLCSFDGAVFACGHSLLLGNEVYDGAFGASYLGERAEDEAFFETDGGHPASCYAGAIRLTCSDPISRIIEPYNKKGWNVDRPYFLAPAKPEPTDLAALGITGDRAFAAFDIFTSYGKYGGCEHFAAFGAVMERLVPGKRIITDLSRNARLALFEGERDDVLFIKTTYPNADGVVLDDVITAPGASVSLAGIYKNAAVYPTGDILKCDISDGRTTVILPEIRGFVAIELEK